MNDISSATMNTPQLAFRTIQYFDCLHDKIKPKKQPLMINPIYGKLNTIFHNKKQPLRQSPNKNKVKLNQKENHMQNPSSIAQGSLVKPTKSFEKYEDSKPFVFAQNRSPNLLPFSQFGFNTLPSTLQGQRLEITRNSSRLLNSSSFNASETTFRSMPISQYLGKNNFQSWKYLESKQQETFEIDLILTSGSKNIDSYPLTQFQQFDFRNSIENSELKLSEFKLVQSSASSINCEPAQNLCRKLDLNDNTTAKNLNFKSSNQPLPLDMVNRRQQNDQNICPNHNIPHHKQKTIINTQQKIQNELIGEQIACNNPLKQSNVNLFFQKYKYEWNFCPQSSSQQHQQYLCVSERGNFYQLKRKDDLSYDQSQSGNKQSFQSSEKQFYQSEKISELQRLKQKVEYYQRMEQFYLQQINRYKKDNQTLEWKLNLVRDQLFANKKQNEHHAQKQIQCQIQRQRKNQMDQKNNKRCNERMLYHLQDQIFQIDYSSQAGITTCGKQSSYKALQSQFLPLQKLQMRQDKINCQNIRRSSSRSNCDSRSNCNSTSKCNSSSNCNRMHQPSKQRAEQVFRFENIVLVESQNQQF